MTKQVLFIASIASHLTAFHRPYLQWFYEQGYEVHVACNGTFDSQYVTQTWQVDFERSPLSLSHLKSYSQLKKIIDSHPYVLLSCHTPMASVLTRLCAIRARKKGTKLLYTAHGFHFFKGASFWAWLTYYPAELTLSRLSDAIICINKEDFELIKSRGDIKPNYYLIPGIGVDAVRFNPVTAEQKESLREELGIAEEDFVMIYAAEFIDRKNHRMLVEAAKHLSAKLDNFTVLLAGKGVLLEDTKNLIEHYNLSSKFRFIGFVGDIQSYYQAADIALSTSRQEGLGINLVEAMMCGIPAIATYDRGHCTVIDHNINGLLCAQEDSEAMAAAMWTLYSDKVQRLVLSKAALIKAATFEIDNSLSTMSKIYADFLE